MSSPRGAETDASADGAPASSSRRRFLRNGLAAGGAVVAGGSLWSVFGERWWLTVRRVDFPVKGLPPALNGFTIAHLSDLHRGPWVSEAFVREAARLAVAYGPDLIVLTGDHVSRSASYARSCAEALSELRAPFGVFAVLGNHEYWTREVGRVVSAHQEAGIRVLVNQAVPVVVGEAAWWLCGLDDIWAGRPDLDRALAHAPDDHFRILLCHAPDFADEAARRGIPLQLSGHSHGGQIRLPGVGPIRLPIYARRYPYGLQRVPGSETFVYTTAGVGVTFPPIRINCRPEVALIRLASA